VTTGSSWVAAGVAGPHAVEFLWATMWAAHRGEIQGQAGAVRRFRPTADRKNEKGFFKSFLNSKII
jgi:hypothetical protein